MTYHIILASCYNHQPTTNTIDKNYHTTILSFLLAIGLSVLSLFSFQFPNFPNHMFIFIPGNLIFLDRSQKFISIVGERKASHQGHRDTQIEQDKKWARNPEKRRKLYKKLNSNQATDAEPMHKKPRSTILRIAQNQTTKIADN